MKDELNIIFQNSNFVLADKNPGVLTVPSRMGVNDPRQVLGLELQRILDRKIFPVHRLDFEVSGLVLFALNTEAHKVANHWFENKMVQKKYRAITRIQNFSHWPEKIPCDRAVIDQVTAQPIYWKTRIFRGKKRSFESSQGDIAETIAEIKKIDLKNDRVDWLLQPLTGRSHQLRFELSRHGFPILGDKLYGSNIEVEQPAIALRSIGLDFRQVVGDRLGLPATVEVNENIKYFSDEVCL